MLFVYVIAARRERLNGRRRKLKKDIVTKKCAQGFAVRINRITDLSTVSRSSGRRGSSQHGTSTRNLSLIDAACISSIVL